ncbi:uncharacterized protein LOC132744603 [Ruditapes philippinarum]|uniref:uncharacterized protein LOC132744603 n=1 Tax=Ruditapes philippinarum TaxID=129788 RepID=UPI00295C37B5|nr:uncharacterized protein LOC132744603 [Ruditapes philippinarum]
MAYSSKLVLILGLFVLKCAHGDSTCSDVDSQACALMEKSKPDLCNSSIGETACQRYCGMCPLECFTCQDLVQDMSQCINVTTCEPNQTCYTAEIFDFDRSHGFAGGCISKEMCIPHRGELFGRSSSAVQTQCCDTDRCNGPSTTTKTTTTTTTTTYSNYD